MRKFTLFRDIDESGVSGAGIVAEGVRFTNGKCVLNWLTKHTSLGIYDSIESLEQIHGHNGKTRIIWEDVTGNAKPKWEIFCGDEVLDIVEAFTESDAWILAEKFRDGGPTDEWVKVRPAKI
jgi:hypothetical protein